MLKLYFYYFLEFLIFGLLIGVSFNYCFSLPKCIIWDYIFLLALAPIMLGAAFRLTYKDFDIFERAKKHKQTIYIDKTEYTKEEIDIIQNFCFSKLSLQKLDSATKYTYKIDTEDELKELNKKQIKDYFARKREYLSYVEKKLLEREV